MKLKKILTLMCCAVLLVCISVGATVAYLTSQDSVTNTFTVGNIVITLDEVPVDTTGAVIAGERRDSNAYHLVPGHEYTKDPIVHFNAGNDRSWVFVKVENGIAAIESQENTIEDQILENDWIKLPNNAGVYYKDVPANEGTTVADYPVFANFKVADDAVLVDENGTAIYSANTPLSITAYAIQYDGFENDPERAWEQFSDNQ